MIKLVVFDIAGTTVDEKGAVYRILRDAVERRGAQLTDEQFKPWTGTDKRWAVTNLLQIGGVEPTPSLVDETYQWFVATLQDSYRADPPQPLPGVPEAIAELRSRSVKVGLTTGFGVEITDPLLAGLGWTVADGDPGATLDAVFTADRVASGRPAPYMIHRVMEATGIQDVAEVAAAGDTAVDVQAARNAGVLSVGVLTGHYTRSDFDGLPHDLIVDSVADLLDDPRFTGATNA